MLNRFITCLLVCAWLAGCAEDPFSIGNGPGGSLATNLDTVALAQDSLFQRELPLISASQLWVGQLNDYRVKTRLLLQFFDFDTTAPWLESDTLTLDSARLMLRHRLNDLGTFQEEHHSTLNLHWVNLDCDSCHDFNQLVYSHLYSTLDTAQEVPRFTTLDQLQLQGVNKVMDSKSEDTLTATLLPLTWFFNDTTGAWRTTVNLMLEMEHPVSGRVRGYMHSFNAREGSEADWPQILFFYHDDTGDTDTLTKLVNYDTYVLHDDAQPAADDLLLSVGDSWQFALRFEDVEYYWEEGQPTEQLHSLTGETIHSAQIHLYPKHATTETNWRFGESASVQVWDVLTWDDSGEMSIDTLVAQTSFTEGTGWERAEVNVTQLVNRWLTRDDYHGVLMRISQASTNLNPARLVYYGMADTTGRQPQLWIYRSEAPF